MYLAEGKHWRRHVVVQTWIALINNSCQSFSKEHCLRKAGGREFKSPLSPTILKGFRFGHGSNHQTRYMCPWKIRLSRPLLYPSPSATACNQLAHTLAFWCIWQKQTLGRHVVVQTWIALINNSCQSFSKEHCLRKGVGVQLPLLHHFERIPGWSWFKPSKPYDVAVKDKTFTAANISKSVSNGMQLACIATLAYLGRSKTLGVGM